MNIIKIHKISQFILKVISFIILTTLISKYKILYNIKSYNNLIDYILIILFFILGILSFIGIIREKVWGLISIYLFAIISTFLSISIIPFIFKIITVDVIAKTILLITFNSIIALIVLFINIIENYYKRKRDS